MTDAVATAVPAASVISAAPESSAPSPGGNGDGGAALLSDDAILGLDESSSTATTTDTPAAPAATTETAAPAAPAPGTEQPLAVEDFKTLFATNPKVQSLWDKYSNSQTLVGKFGTVADAHKAADIVQMLGGPQHLESLAQKAADVDATDAAFFGGSAADRKKLSEDWYAGEGPHEFPVTSKAVFDQTLATLEVMQQRDPERWGDIRSQIVTDVLQQHNFGAYLAGIANAYKASGQTPPKEVQDMLAWARYYGLDKGKTTGEQSPESQRLAARQKELDQRDQTWNQQQTDAVLTEAGTQLWATVRPEIDKALSDLKVNDRPVFGANSTQIRKTIQASIEDHLSKALIANPVLQAQILSLQSKGFIGKTKEVTDLNLRFARLQLPASIQAVMEPWTDSVVKQAKGAAERATNGASRVDISGGSGAGGRTKPSLTLDAMRKDGFKLTDDEILNA